MIRRWFWREWRSPSLLIVWLSLTLAVACVLALGTLSDRMEKGLNQQSRDFIAADRILRSSHPVDESWLRQAESDGLNLNRQIGFMTMAYAGDKPLLVAVKATDEHYPLYGKLETAPAELKPQPGEAMVAPRLLAMLGIKVGDSIDIGDTTLRISGEVIQEPDAGFNPFETAPRVIIHLSDAEKTGAIQPGSRLSYRYLFSGNEQAIEGFGAEIEPQLKPDQRWIGLERSGNALGKSIERAQFFLLLSAVLTLMLASAAVAVAMGHYCRSRYDLVAVLKTLGAGRKALWRLIVGQWVSVLLLAAIVGSLLGIVFERLLIVLLSPVLPASLPDAGIWPWFWSLGILIILTLLIGLRPYKQLLATRPQRVLRKDKIVAVWPLKYYLPIQCLIVVGLLALVVGFNAMWWGLLAGILVLVGLLGVIGWGGLYLLRHLSVKSLAFRLAINRLLRQPILTTIQLGSFAFSFMLLALLFMLRGELLDRWMQQLPPESPNYFVMNMTAQQVPQMQHFLSEHHVDAGTYYPIVRVRLMQINEQDALERIQPDDPGYEAVNRELNLTWLTKMPSPNPVTAGTWPPKSGEVSIDEGVANRLGVKIGDRVSFSSDTQPFTATISSLRHVDWESLRPNFYFIFPEGALDTLPQTYLTSFRYDGDSQFLIDLNRQFPTLSLLDIGNILRQISQVLQQVSRALEVMVALVMACGALLLMAQIQVGMRQRRQELVVYRTLGASKGLLRSTLWGEFALLGFVAGLTAAIGAEVSIAWIQTQVLAFPWQPNVVMWVTLPLVGALLLSLTGGWLGLRLLRGRALFRRYQDG